MSDDDRATGDQTAGDRTAGDPPEGEGPKVDPPKVDPPKGDRPKVEPWPEGPPPGGGIIRLDLVATVAFALVTLIGSVWERGITDLANLVVSAVLFLGGCVAFAVGFVRAAGRSRTEVVDLAGLFYLTGSGPPQARRPLLGLWFAQIAVAVASVFTLQPPFGVMAPVWGIGVIALWGSRHGRFPARTEAELRRTGPARRPVGP